jgi:hypothetical protein
VLWAKNQKTPKQRRNTMLPPTAPSFHHADKQTYRRVAVLGALFCTAFVMISLSLRPQPVETRVLVKADRLVRIAGQATPAN